MFKKITASNNNNDFCLQTSQFNIKFINPKNIFSAQTLLSAFMVKLIQILTLIFQLLLNMNRYNNIWMNVHKNKNIFLVHFKYKC